MPGNRRPTPAHSIDAYHYHLAKNERGFIVSEEYTGVSSGENAVLHLQNPDGNSRTVVFKDIYPAAQFKAAIRIHDGFSSAPSGGSTAGIQNALLDGTNGVDAGTMTANRGVTFTADSTHLNTVVGGGEGAHTSGGASHPPVFGLEPGREIVVEIENISDSTTDTATITLAYSEAPRKFTETT